MITMNEFHQLNVYTSNANNDDSYQNVVNDSDELQKEINYIDNCAHILLFP